MTKHDDFQRFMRGVPRQRMTRRDLLRRMGIGAGALSATALLAACGVDAEQQPRADQGPADPAEGYTTNEVTGTLNFANWPLYIDKAKGRRPTIDDFTKATDIKVKYDEVINDNASFFGRIREPLANDQPIEWDLIVVTDWLVAKMARLGYLEELDHARLPNFEQHGADIYKDPVYDPGNAHSIPWQSGITGIGYNPKLTGREITSSNDLFDPEFKGKVGMFTEMRDTMNLTLLNLGVDPRDASLEDAEAAQEKLLEQRDAGIVRAYYGNEYADALGKGDLALTMAWSGDVFQLQFDNPDLRFVVPEEGGILWTDLMAIPQNAAHPVDALEFMNFVYQPDIAGQIAGWVNYITPVPAAKEFLLDLAREQDDPYYRQVANSPLVFTTPEMESRLHSYRDLDEQEEAEWNELFDAVVQG